MSGKSHIKADTEPQRDRQAQINIVQPASRSLQPALMPYTFSQSRYKVEMHPYLNIHFLLPVEFYSFDTAHSPSQKIFHLYMVHNKRTKIVEMPCFNHLIASLTQLFYDMLNFVPFLFYISYYG